MQSRLKLHVLAFVLIAVLASAVYANSLKGDFFWDDLGLIKENHLIKNFSYLPQLFSRPISETFHYCYRPLLNLSFMIDYHIWQLNPFGYHLTALIIHILNAFLVYMLAFLLSKDFKLGAAAGLIFSVHSVLSEPVNYLSSRADLLIGLFCLSSFILYILYRESEPKKKIFLVASVVLFICGLLSKEMAIVLILMLLLYELVLVGRKQDIKRRLLFILPYLIALIAFALIRASVLKANTPSYIERFAIAELPLWQRFSTSLTAIPTYLRLLLVPVGLHKEWLRQPVESILTWSVVSSLGVAAVFLFLAKFIYRYSKICTFGILWFFVLLLPVLNIFPLNSFLSEAWLYLPSIGFIMFMAALLLKFTPQKSKITKFMLVVVLVGILCFYSFLTLKRNHVWASERQTFFSEISEFNPYSSRAFTNLGLIYVEQDKLPEAIEEFVKALEIEPDNPGLHRNMGNVYMRLNKFDLAQRAYAKALSINPNDSETLGNLGNLYSNLGDTDKAIEYFQKAIEINPYSANFHNSLGTAYFKKGDLEAAVEEYRKAIDVAPDNSKAHANLGITYYHMQSLDEAIAQFNESIRLDPEYIDAYFNLGVIYFRSGDLEKSKQNLYKTVSLAGQQNKAAFAQNAQTLLGQMQ